MSYPIDLPTTFVPSQELQNCKHYHLAYDPKIALYHTTLLPSTSELEDICSLVSKSYRDYVGIQDLDDDLYPAPQANFSGKRLADVVEYHFNHFDKVWRDCSGNNQGTVEWYPFAFVAVDLEDWQGGGLTVVSWDWGRWKSGCFEVQAY